MGIGIWDGEMVIRIEDWGLGLGILIVDWDWDSGLGYGVEWY